MAINFFFYKFMTRFSVFCCFLSNKICSSLVSQQPFITLKYFSIHNLKTNLKKTEHETGNGGFFRYIIHIFRGEKRFGF